MIVVPMTLREANDFVANYHRHNGRTSRNGGKFAIGASQDGELWGVAIIGNPISGTFMDGFTAEVLRTCVRPEAPGNVNSFLYGAAWRVWRAMGGHRLITYTLQTESGASLRGAGWKIVGEVARLRTAGERTTTSTTLASGSQSWGSSSSGGKSRRMWHERTARRVPAVGDTGER